MTTLQVRAREQAIERRVAALARPADRDVGEVARSLASGEVAERIAGHLSREQTGALEVITGPERAAVLVGPAGTGKGVVIDAAARRVSGLLCVAGRVVSRVVGLRSGS